MRFAALISSKAMIVSPNLVARTISKYLIAAHCKCSFNEQHRKLKYAEYIELPSNSSTFSSTTFKPSLEKPRLHGLNLHLLVILPEDVCQSADDTTNTTKLKDGKWDWMLKWTTVESGSHVCCRKVCGLAVVDASEHGEKLQHT